MRDNWAENFYEILESLRLKDELLQNVKLLIETKEIVGKSLQGGNRKQEFRDILTNLVDGNITLSDSYGLVERQISRSSSMFNGDNRVFPNNWGERLVRTNLSKFYNQAVLIYILNQGDTTCFVPHSQHEEGTQCSISAGQIYDARSMLHKLEQAYEGGIFSREFKIPDHPHCTHVIIPVG